MVILSFGTDNFQWAKHYMQNIVYNSSQCAKLQTGKYHRDFDYCNYY